MRRPLRLIATTATSLALLTTPVLARDHYRGGAWNDRGWHDRGWDRRHRDNGVSAGDVIAGVAVIGAIAAIAGVFDGGNDRENEPVPVRYPEGDTRGYVAGTGSGLDSAVDICIAEIEASGPRISGVDSANRTADGWFVSGAMESGAPFTCRIGNDGRVADVEIGDNGTPVDGGYYGASVDDQQYDDATYYRARNGLGDGQSYSAR